MKLIYVLIAAGCLAGPAYADPYAAGQRELLISHGDELLAEAKLLFSAAKCNVIPASSAIGAATVGWAELYKEAAIVGSKITMEKETLHEFWKLRQMDPDTIARLGGCEYWTEHPENVAYIRKMAWIAISSIGR